MAHFEIEDARLIETNDKAARRAKGVRGNVVPFTKSRPDAGVCTVALCRCGRARVIAINSEMSRQTRCDLNEARIDGARIVEMSVEQVTQIGMGCACQTPARQRELGL